MGNFNAIDSPKELENIITEYMMETEEYITYLLMDAIHKHSTDFCRFRHLWLNTCESRVVVKSRDGGVAHGPYLSNRRAAKSYFVELRKDPFYVHDSDWAADDTYCLFLFDMDPKRVQKWTLEDWDLARSDKADYNKMITEQYSDDDQDYFPPSDTVIPR